MMLFSPVVVAVRMSVALALTLVGLVCLPGTPANKTFDAGMYD